MNKEELVEVTIKVPKNVLDFLKAMEKTLDMTVKEYMESAIIQMVGADIGTDDVFLPSTYDIIEKYGLAKYLKDTIVGMECKEVLAVKTK